jgi:hypothetical protein
MFVIQLAQLPEAERARAQKPSDAGERPLLGHERGRAARALIGIELANSELANSELAGTPELSPQGPGSRSRRPRGRTALEEIDGKDPTKPPPGEGPRGTTATMANRRSRLRENHR